MLDNIIISIQAVVPLFFVMGLGYLVKLNRWMSPDELRHLNGVVFKLFFYFLMFTNIYKADYSKTIKPSLMLFGLLGVLGVWAASIVFAMSVEKSNRTRGAIIHALYRSNFVILGISIVGNIFGMENLGVTVMMISIVVPLYNILAVITLESFRGRSFSIVNVTLGVLKNPMLLGVLTAFVIRALGIVPPDFLLKPAMQMGAAATPIALIVLGASFEKQKKSVDKRNLYYCILGRLVVIPAVMLSIAYYLGFRGIEFVTLIAIFSSPCAIITYAMAQQMDSDDVLSGNSVVYTTLLSGITMFLWILFFKTIGVF